MSNSDFSGLRIGPRSLPLVLTFLGSIGLGIGGFSLIKPADDRECSCEALRREYVTLFEALSDRIDLLER